LTIADGAANDQAGIVERGSESIRQRIHQPSGIVNRARAVPEQAAGVV